MTQIYGKIFKYGVLSHSHLKVIELVGQKKKVLELGASTGYITKRLSGASCVVDVVEIDKDDARQAVKYARRAFVGSLEDGRLLGRIQAQYDFILACDVLEHLVFPGQVLKALKKNLNDIGRIVISLPNIACWGVRRDLFFQGDFTYQESGILDKTHLRFYTYFTIQDLIRSCGFCIENIFIMEYCYPFRSLVLKLRGLGVRIDRVICRGLSSYFPNFCAMHLIFVAFVKHE